MDVFFKQEGIHFFADFFIICFCGYLYNIRNLYNVNRKALKPLAASELYLYVCMVSRRNAQGRRYEEFFRLLACP